MAHKTATTSTGAGAASDLSACYVLGCASSHTKLDGRFIED
jgi:hypothetical protein